MKNISFREAIRIIKPEYVFLKLKPNNSIRNNDSHKLAKTISSLHRNIRAHIKKEEAKLIRFMGKELMLGTKYSYTIPCKVAYYIYIEKKKAEFYFILPKQHLSVIKERMSDVWKNITVEQVKDIPLFMQQAAKYQMVYAKEDPLSLATDRRDNDLLKSNLNIIDVMEEGDKVGIFYNFIPISQFPWRSTYRNTMNKLKNKMPVDRDKFGLTYILRVVISQLTLLVRDLGEALSGEKKEQKMMQYIDTAVERMQGKPIEGDTLKKGNDVIIDTQILVLSESRDKLKQRNNAYSLVLSFDSISNDNHLVPRQFNGKVDFLTLRMNGVEVNKVSSGEAQNFLSLPGRELLEQYNMIEKVETQETEVPEDLRNGIMRIGTNTFRGSDQMAYLSNDSEYKYLTLVLIGPTRAGKSTLIQNLSYDAIQAGECVIMFDFIKNCELSEEVAAIIPKDKILNIECNDFRKLQGLGYNEVGYSNDVFIQYDNAKRQTTQLMTLINSINSDDTRLTAKMERYLTSASLVVFISGGSIRDVFSVLQDHRARAQFMNNVPASQMENLHEYMLSLQELDEYDNKGIAIIGTRYTKIEGIIDRLNKLNANTYMELMLKKDTKQNIDLSKELQKNQLICIKMPESMFSTDQERDIYTTYWITKLWLSLQVRGQRIKDRSKLTKVNLFIDELYQVENTQRFLSDKLSRLAKFGIKPIISCHYLNQIRHIRQELKSANTSYMLISGCDKDNYKELASELQPFELEDLLNLPRYHSLNLIKDEDRYARFITHLPKPIGGK
jgi:adenylate kinase